MDKKQLNQIEVVAVQKATQDQWSYTYNIQALLRYVQHSKIRIMQHYLKTYRVRQNSAARVLDYGYGAGWSLFYFKPSCEIYGIELSDKAITAASRKAERKGYVVSEFCKPPEDDSLRINYPCGFFDVVICSHVIEHVYDDDKLLSELCRVLKEDGKAFLLVPLDLPKSDLPRNREERRNPAFPARSFHVWNYDFTTFVDVVKKSGFSVIEAEQLDAIMEQRKSWNRVSQIISAILWAVVPYRLWWRFDRLARRRGFTCRQGMIVCTKI